MTEKLVVQIMAGKYVLMRNRFFGEQSDSYWIGICSKNLLNPCSEQISR